MYIERKLTHLVLLYSLSVLHLFGSQPPLPAALQAEFTTIDGMSDHEILCTAAPMTQENAEKWLGQSKQDFKECINQELEAFNRSYVTLVRITHKYARANKMLESCSDYALHQQLHTHCCKLKAEQDAYIDQAQQTTQSLIKGKMISLSAYSYSVKMLNVHVSQVSILRAQKEKLEQEQAQWQQERQSLLTKLKNYQQCTDLLYLPNSPNI